MAIMPLIAVQDDHPERRVMMLSARACEDGWAAAFRWEWVGFAMCAVYTVEDNQYWFLIYSFVYRVLRFLFCDLHVLAPFWDIRCG
jgi:hypothetical protein